MWANHPVEKYTSLRYWVFGQYERDELVTAVIGCPGRAVIHSMRQLISYSRSDDYLPNRSIRIPLMHDARGGVVSDGGDNAWNP